MKTKIATGVVVEYDDAGAGPPVVLLHAFPLSRAMWREQVAALSSDHRIIVPDLRGFGGTGGFDGTPSIARMAADVDALLNRLRIKAPVSLGGLSMGGYVALSFAEQFPDRLRSLILADTRAEADTADSKANREKMIAFAHGQTALAVLNQMLPRMVSPTTIADRPGVIEEIRKIASGQSIPGLIGALQAMRDRPDARPWLGRIAAPALVVVGSHDLITPLEAATALSSGLRNARLVEIKSAGHLANLEQPAQFNDAVRLFLETLA